MLFSRFDEGVRLRFQGPPGAGSGMQLRRRGEDADFLRNCTYFDILPEETRARCPPISRCARRGNSRRRGATGQLQGPVYDDAVFRHSAFVQMVSVSGSFTRSAPNGCMEDCNRQESPRRTSPKSQRVRETNGRHSSWLYKLARKRSQSPNPAASRRAWASLSVP
jgi:hypothetical protein